MKTRAAKGVSAGSFPQDLLMTPEWTSLSLQAQVLYYVLWLDDSSTHLGTRRFHPTALTRRLPGLDEDQIVAAATDLANGGWVVVDEDDQLIHLRGWIARDGLTSSPRLGWAFRSAWDVVESPTIRASALNDLRLSYEVDREGFETGEAQRGKVKRRSAENKPKDPDGETSFWQHGHIVDIQQQMPQSPTGTPLDGQHFTRMMPLAFGRGSGRAQFATLGYLDMWTYLTLYLRADHAGVVTGPAPTMLRRRATGPEVTAEGMKVSVRSLTQNGWIETDSGDNGDALRIRFFHLHEGSTKKSTRGYSITGETLRIESDRLRAGVISDLALALTLGISIPKSEKTFWHTTEELWLQGRPRVYDAADLHEHCIGEGLPGWTGEAPPAGAFRWVPRHEISHSGDTLTGTVTDTLTHTLTDTVTNTLTPKSEVSGEALHSGLDQSMNTLTNTLTDRVTDTVAGTPLMYEVRGLVSDVGGLRSGGLSGTHPTDGRTDLHSSLPSNDEHLTSARGWVADLAARPDGQRIDVRDSERLTALVAARFKAGQTGHDIDAIVDETLGRRDTVVNLGGYLLTVLEEPDRLARPSRGTYQPGRGSPANRGASMRRPANDPFGDLGGRSQ